MFGLQAVGARVQALVHAAEVAVGRTPLFCVVFVVVAIDAAHERRQVAVLAVFVYSGGHEAFHGCGLTLRVYGVKLACGAGCELAAAVHSGHVVYDGVEVFVAAVIDVVGEVLVSGQAVGVLPEQFDVLFCHDAVGIVSQRYNFYFTAPKSMRLLLRAELSARYFPDISSCVRRYL